MTGYFYPHNQLEMEEITSMLNTRKTLWQTIEEEFCTIIEQINSFDEKLQQMQRHADIMRLLDIAVAVIRLFRNQEQLNKINSKIIEEARNINRELSERLEERLEDMIRKNKYELEKENAEIRNLEYNLNRQYYMDTWGFDKPDSIGIIDMNSF